MFVVHTSIGLVLVVLGAVALRDIWWTSEFGEVSRSWAAVRASSLALGMVLAIATFVWPLAFGYPYEFADGRGRMIGLPFLVAAFDSEGRDYVGPLTGPSAIANAFVWLSLPAVVLSVYARVKRRVAAGV